MLGFIDVISGSIDVGSQGVQGKLAHTYRLRLTIGLSIFTKRQIYYVIYFTQFIYFNILNNKIILKNRVDFKSDFIYLVYSNYL